MHEKAQSMLSAFLDGELTQADQQRVSLHLQQCEACRAEFQQLKTLKDLTGELSFIGPPEDKMDEIARKLSVQTPRVFGWGFFGAGLVLWAGYAAYLFVTTPDIPPLEKLLTGGVVIGFLLLLASVGWQRWLQLPHDRYRGVKR